jgi:hypothetical protein
VPKIVLENNNPTEYELPDLDDIEADLMSPFESNYKQTIDTDLQGTFKQFKDSQSTPNLMQPK